MQRYSGEDPGIEKHRVREELREKVQRNRALKKQRYNEND